eukprot:gene6620-8191_t
MQQIPVEDQVYLNTLDEPLRDVKTVLWKLYHVIIPRGKATDALRDWDLWGPLLLCLAMAVLLSTSAQDTQKALVFAIVFVVIWLGAVFVTINAQLLGGKLSFFQSVCVLGYCIFPLTIATLVIWIASKPLDNGLHIAIKLPIVAAAWAWSTFASYGFLSSSVPPARRALAAYPVLLFYLIISWLVVIQ